MKKIIITTPENIEIEYKLAGLASRAAAAVIDLLVQSAAGILLVIANVLVARFSPELWQKSYGWFVGISLLIYVLISYGYFIVMELTMNGMTLGKKVLKLRAIRMNGQPVTLKHSAIRNLFKIFIDIYGIGFALILFTRNNQRVGDFAASTIVIAEENRARPLTLESLNVVSENLRHYITGEEEDLLREYMERKNQMEDCRRLREMLIMYFTEKFEALGIFHEAEEFISKL